MLTNLSGNNNWENVMFKLRLIKDKNGYYVIQYNYCFFFWENWDDEKFTDILTAVDEYNFIQRNYC